MAFEKNINQNNNLDALLRQAPGHVVKAIRQASAKTGVDFAYLVEKAGAESSFNPLAKAKTSSATGLFQFIEKTWMSMVKTHGDKYGLSAYADKIDDQGRVKDSKTRQDILNLRRDPQIASYMAAEFASDNQEYLQRTVGGDITPTDLYFAHFLGAGGASAFINQKNKNPSALAADLFPKEALANRNVFFDSKTGKPKTLGQIYDAFDHKFTDEVLKPENPLRVARVDNTKMGNNEDTLFQAYKLSAYRYVIPSPADRPADGLPEQLSSITQTVQQTLSVREDQQIFPHALYQRAPISQVAILLLQDRYND